MTDAGPEASGQSGGGPKPAGESSGAGSKPGSEGSGVTYSQEQVDTFIAEAKRREAARFGDYDEVKRRLAEIEAAGQTELERAQAAAKDSDAKANAAVARANHLAVRSALTSAAARAGVVDPELVVALLGDGITVDDAGEIAADVDKAVVELLEAKPYLKANGTTPPRFGTVDQGAHGRGSSAPSKPSTEMDDLLRRNR